MSAAASVYAIVGLLLPAYGPPRAPWPGEVASATPLQANLGGAAEVEAVRLSAASVRPGEVLRVTVYWQPLDVTPAHTPPSCSLVSRPMARSWRSKTCIPAGAPASLMAGC